MIDLIRRVQCMRTRDTQPFLPRRDNFFYSLGNAAQAGGSR